MSMDIGPIQTGLRSIGPIQLTTVTSTPATSVARYLLDEGTGTLLNDSTGNGNDLTLNLNGNGSWLTGTGRGGVSSTLPVGTGDASFSMSANLLDISTNGNLGSTFKESTGMSVVMVVDLPTFGTSNGENLFRLGPNGFPYGDVEIVHAEGVQLNWGRSGDSGGGAVLFQDYDLLSGAESSPFVITMVIDTTQALLADRAKVWYNQTPIPLALTQVSPLGQGTTLGSIDNTNRNLCWFNSNNVDNTSFPKNVEGSLYYGEIFSGQLTEAQVLSYASNLLANANIDGSIAAVTGGARFTGTLAAWDTELPYASGAGMQMFASTEFGSAAVNSSAHIFTTDASGVYDTVVPECTPGVLYWVQKISSDESISSLNLQLAQEV